MGMPPPLVPGGVGNEAGSKSDMAFFYLLFVSLLRLAAGAAIPGSQDVLLCAADSRQIVSNDSSPYVWPWQTYQSSAAQPPVLMISSTGEPLFDGLIVIDTSKGTQLPATKQEAPLLITDTGDLVWSGPTGEFYNVRAQTFNGSPVLTYFSGQGTAGASAIVGHGYGSVVVLDTQYNEIARVCPRFNGFTMETGVTADCNADLHESLITSRNTMLITAYNTTRADLSSVGGPKDGWVLDSISAEVNITTGEVLFLWSPLAHVPLNQSHYQPPGPIGQNQSVPYDFFHANSIQLVGENYLINNRHYWATYLVSPQGKILWQINGKDGGDFGPLPEGASFSWEHFARVHEYNSSSAVISWFGNNNALPGQNVTKPSTGVTLRLTLPPDPSSPPVLLSNLTDPQLRVDAWSQGSFTPLPNGNLFIGYGSDPVLIEYGPLDSANPEGHARWTATFGYGDLVSSYRAYKQVWHATPATQPSLVVLDVSTHPGLHCAGNATHLGYVSWNGATDVTSWVLYAGANKNSLAAVGQFPKGGFETQFAIPQDAAFVQVGAVENSGTSPVRKSNVVAVGS